MRSGEYRFREVPPLVAEWISRLASGGWVVDLGSGEPASHLPWIELVPLGTPLVKIDLQTRLRPDIAADVQMLPFRDGSISGILATSVLEHVPRPWLAVDEIHRVLRRDGAVVGYVPFMWPYHADKTFHDYFRFSDEAIRSLFSNFSAVKTVPTSGYTGTALRFAAGFTASERHLLRFQPFLSGLLSRLLSGASKRYPTRFDGLRRSPTGYHFLAVK